MVIMHVWFVGLWEHHGEIAGGHMVRPLFLLSEFFCLVEILWKGSGVWYFGIMDWEGSSSWAFFYSPHLGIEILNVGGWLTHGDLALDTGVDFLAVVEHRLIPARVRSEWSRLRRKDFASIWSPASQVSSHVGSAGVGVVRLRGAPFLFPPLLLLNLRGSLTLVGLSGVWFLLVLVGLCILLFYTVFRVLILMLSSFH